MSHLKKSEEVRSSSYKTLKTYVGQVRLIFSALLSTSKASGLRVHAAVAVCLVHRHQHTQARWQGEAHGRTRTHLHLYTAPHQQESLTQSGVPPAQK